MATIIPSINSSSTKMTTGERRLGQRLEQFLEDDYLCWYDIPVGDTRRYPDFIILHPSRGLLFLEVKDWKLSSIQSMNHQSFTLLTGSGTVSHSNPIEQARQCAYQVVNMLKRDKALVQTNEKHKGALVCPYGYGVVFTNISRKQLEAALGEEGESILPSHLVICQDEMLEKTDPEEFQERLWNMFNYQFSNKLTLPQIDRIRHHLYPEIRIGTGTVDLFSLQDDAEAPIADIPDIVKVMDMQQEQLARSFGEGHRVVHGVAGSGKTLILGFRCWYLAQTQSKPILVLCYNISLANKLRSFIHEKCASDKVHIYHFHDWCGQQLHSYHVDLLAGTQPVYERQVLSVINGVENGFIPRAQYGAVLIDEGHDFEAEWLKLIVQMVDPETNSLLLLYDDAQSIYKKKSSLDFSLSSVGIQARGRTSILKLNYRNTREILNFAFDFAKDYLHEKSTDEDSVPLIKPEMAGKNGPVPEFRLRENLASEVTFISRCLRKWHQDGVAWSDMAVIYCDGHVGRALVKELNQLGVPNVWGGDRNQRRSYDPKEDKVLLVTPQSSKGLEFPRVVVAGVGLLDDKEEEHHSNARLLYVAMTRAQERLLITASSTNAYVSRFV